MVPMLPVKPEGPAYDHVTAELKPPVPATVATNCTWVPMVAVVGVTVIEVIVGPVGGGGVIVLPPPHPANSNSRHANADTAAHKIGLLMGCSVLPSAVWHSVGKVLPKTQFNFDTILHLFSNAQHRVRDRAKASK
jgi:hypothetical protein